MAIYERMGVPKALAWAVTRRYRQLAVSTGRLARGLTKSLSGSAVTALRAPETPEPLITSDVAVLYRDSVVLVPPESMADLQVMEAEAVNLRTQAENLAASEANISDADVALELTHFVRTQLLVQPGVVRLTQQYSVPHMALALVGG